MGQFIETYRGRVAAWECDHFGHMNVRFYMACISDAASTLLAAMGLPSAHMEERRLGFAAVHQELDYRRELLAGELIRMEGAVAAIEGRKIVYLHRMYNAETGELALTARVIGLLLDLDARRSVPVPDYVREAARAITVGEPA